MWVNAWLGSMDELSGGSILSLFNSYLRAAQRCAHGWVKAEALGNGWIAAARHRRQRGRYTSQTWRGAYVLCSPTSIIAGFRAAL